MYLFEAIFKGCFAVHKLGEFHESLSTIEIVITFFVSFHSISIIKHSVLSRATSENFAW